MFALAALAVGHLERGVANLAGFFAKDGAQQALLGSQLGLACGRALANQVVTRAYLGPDPDDSFVIEVTQDLFCDVRDVPGDLLSTELGVASLDLVLLNMN